MCVCVCVSALSKAKQDQAIADNAFSELPGLPAPSLDGDDFRYFYASSGAALKLYSRFLIDLLLLPLFDCAFMMKHGNVWGR